MAAFRFEAVDALGKVKRGVVEADTVRIARSRLRDMQLTPLKVDTLQEDKSAGPNTSGVRLRGSVSSYELGLPRQVTGDHRR